MLGRTAIGVVTLGVLLAGCAGKRVEPSPLPAFETTLSARVAWRASAGGSGGSIFSPASVQDKVCAAAAHGRVSCFNRVNGTRAWTRRTAVTLTGGVGAGENMIIVGTSKGEVLAFGVDGIPLWRAQVSSEVLSAPVEAGSLVLVRTGDGKVFGLDARDGRQIWEYQSTPQSLTLRSNPGMAVTDDESAVIAGFPGGRLVKLDVPTGSILWEVQVATPRGDNELERIADIAGTPLLRRDRVCAVAFQGKIGCYELEKGGQIWSRGASSGGSISADERNVYYTESDGTVVAYDKETGASVWRQDKLLNRRVSAPLVVGEWIVVGDFEGYVHVLAHDTGAFVARLATDDSEIITAPVRVEDAALFQTEAGGLYMVAFGR